MTIPAESVVSRTESGDVQQLIREIHQDRQNAKDKERREGWTKYVSLMVVILAVATAIGSLKAGGFSSQVMLNQAKASDTWAFYQAKSIKQRLAQFMADTGTGENAARAASDVVRYRDEEKKLEKDAKDYEASRDLAAKHGPPLGLAIAALQIAIALASVCLITRRKALWAAAGAMGALGLTYLVWGLYFV